MKHSRHPLSKTSIESKHMGANLAKTIPHIQEPPLIGSLFTHMHDRLNLYLRVAHECGDIGRFRYGPVMFIQINSSELVHRILVEQADDFEKGAPMRRAFQPLIGNGL